MQQPHDDQESSETAPEESLGGVSRDVRDQVAQSAVDCCIDVKNFSATSTTQPDAPAEDGGHPIEVTGSKITIALNSNSQSKLKTNYVAHPK